MTVITKNDVWQLEAQESWLVTASTAWGTLRTRARSARTDQGTVKDRVSCAWEGARATSYLGYAPTVAAGLGELAEMAGAVIADLESLHELVTDTQGRLDRSYGRAGAGADSVVRGGGSVTFTFPDGVDTSHVGAEYSEALTAVEEARQVIGERVTSLNAVAAAAATLADTWSGPAAGLPLWDVPLGGGFEPQTTSLDGTTTVTTGNDDDRITVTVDPETGETVISITYMTDSQCVVKEIRVPAGQEVVINTGGGSDTITVPAGVDVHLRFATGEGGDKVVAQQAGGNLEVFGSTGADEIETGAGRDFIDAGAGQDYVDSGDGDDRVFGGEGNDVLYGMGGDDVISGGDGHDYLEGARGDDQLFGEGEDDIISGGFGDDRGWGGAGDDTLYAGAGTDAFHGGTGTDKFTGEAGDAGSGMEQTIIIEIPAEEHYRRWLEFEVGGSDAFKERVLADLHMMASSETGQAMLEAQGRHYDESGGLFGLGKDTVTIREYDENNASAVTDLSVNYNPDFIMGITSDDPRGHTGTPPVVILFHELGHINQYRSHDWQDWYVKNPDGSLATDANGHLIKLEKSPGQYLIEMQNVGLEWDTTIVPNADGDNYDPRLTENGFRDEFGLPRRGRY